MRRTVDEGLFPEPDVSFAVDVLRTTITPEILKRWVERAASGTGERRSILCLHAGNLPLVGLQDVISVLLSGHRYYGKISRKDPWLLTSFLEIVRDSGDNGYDFNDAVAGYSTDLHEFSGLGADAVMFAGSSKSVPVVKDELFRIKAVHPETRYLIRSARFSVAHVSRRESVRDLTGAITQYRGRGCRSVGVVVSPMGLHEYFGGSVLASDVYPESKIVHDDARRTVNPGNRDRYGYEYGYRRFITAYAKSVGTPCMQAGEMVLIESGDLSLIGPGIVLWMQHREGMPEGLISRLAPGLQSVYSDSDSINSLNSKSRKSSMYSMYSKNNMNSCNSGDPGREATGSHIKDGNERANSGSDRNVYDRLSHGNGDELFEPFCLEPLYNAQRPDIDWKPDGTDPLKWINNL